MFSIDEVYSAHTAESTVVSIYKSKQTRIMCVRALRLKQHHGNLNQDKADKKVKTFNAIFRFML